MTVDVASTVYNIICMGPGLMRKLCAALFIFFSLLSGGAAQGIGAQPIVCNKVVASATLTVGTTQLIAGTTGQLIDVCGFVLKA